VLSSEKTGGLIMTKQLNLRVEEEFIARLESLSRKLGRPMSTTLVSIGLPAIEEAEAELQFEADALNAWEKYELTGEHVTSDEVESLFEAARNKAVNATKK
jgi:predicted transcriptional regulator